MATLFIPDAFSPNGDNIHDTWEIYGLSSYCNSNGVMLIFNQDGALVYDSNVVSPVGGYHLKTWNGRVNNTGSMVPVGTYYYVFTLGSKTYKSFVFVSY